ncbi:TlpA family protein disulfide reductase [Pseudonocardia sp. KRD-169]|uniref:TlpA family protein disulfide reductase n=2 Tax=Pseudonocardia abyssalis TaxID=2792008 RepID=A0ABS6ULW5_9PSEU|nr:TlpA family protein disulfide reductase [Pseudonocardia abyssalis]MBW0133233.1 TlpA family protein disulfide reductase [Pseudonocardia abyssalis]
MSSELRWTVLVVVLTVAGVVALWPRPDAYPDAAADTLPVAAERLAERPDDAALGPARAAAALPPCPVPSGAPVPPGPLADVVVPCLSEVGAVPLGAALAGRPVLLNLWASWCAPCREEIPVLNAYTARPDAIDVVGVVVRDRPADALAMADELDPLYPSVLDPDNAVQAALGAPPVLPTNWVVRPDGSAVRVTDPLVFRDPAQVAAAVEAALATTG